MFAFGAMEILVLLGLSGGSLSGDLASYIPTEVYFQSRRIPVNIENMEDLAKADPADGKAQLLQLLALRTLAEQPELVKKAKDPAAVLKTIEKIAKGEIAKDRLGFSQEYATRTLIALGSNIAPPKPAKPGDPREQTLSWFPASATLAGFLDGSRGADAGADQAKDMRKLLTKLVPPREWDEVFKVAEMIGNVRIDRIGFAYAADAKDRDKDRFFVRISGKGDHKRIVAAFKNLPGGDRLPVKEFKDDNGTPITTVQQFSATFALIGDTDFVIAGYAAGKRVKGQEPPDPKEVLDQLLAVRAGKEMPVLKGALKDRLAKISKETVGLLVGDVPEELRREISREKVPAPKSVRVELLRNKDGMDVRFQGEMENADAAKEFTKFIVKMRQDGLDGLKKIPNEIPLPVSTVNAMRKTLESIQIQTKGAGVEGGVFVPTEALMSGPLWLLGRAGAEPGLPPPLPPPLPPLPRRELPLPRVIPVLIGG